MSNRRRLPSEKARRPRCRRCKTRDVLAKVFPDGTVLVCQRDGCGHVTPAQPVTVPEPEGGGEG